MADGDKDGKKEFSFITEEIVEKKRPFYVKILECIALAVVFGIAAGATFSLIVNNKNKIDTSDEPQTISIPADEESMETNENGETVEQVETETESVSVELTGDNVEEFYSYFYEIVNEANKSIVSVTAVTSDTDWFNETYESTSSTYGLIIAENEAELLILTQADVVRAVDNIKISFIDNSTVTARVKKLDSTTGIAVLAVDTSLISDSTFYNIKIANLGNSYSIREGQTVMSIGAPLGYTYSFSYGVVAATDKTMSTVDGIFKLINTDITQSSTGSGVVIDTDGDVIGIITNKVSSENISVAIGISEIKQIIENLSNGIDIGYLGVSCADVTEDIATANDMPKGVYVTECAIDSPAIGAGILNGDIIIGINDEAVTTIKSMQKQLQQYTVGSTITVTVMRRGKDGYVEFEFENVVLGSTSN